MLDAHAHAMQVNLCKANTQGVTRYTPEKRAAIQDEINRLLKADFVREVPFPEWLANPIMVKKPNGTWRICVDYTDLNKACPKDEYPLLRIDQIVD